MFPSSPGGDHKGKGCDVGFVTGNKKKKEGEVELSWKEMFVLVFN
jgi:hypothetical protein